MKITEHSADRLVIDHVPWGLLAVLLGFMSIWVAGSVRFILIGEPGGAVIFMALGTVLPMLAVFLLVHRNQLVLCRTTAALELRRRDFRGFSKRSFALNNVARAYVAKDTPRHGSLFVEITGGMDAGHHRFVETNSKLPAVTQAATAINDWLEAAPDEA